MEARDPQSACRFMRNAIVPAAVIMDARPAKLQWLGAYYKEPKNFFANFAVDHDKMEVVWDDYATPKDQMDAAVISAALRQIKDAK